MKQLTYVLGICLLFISATATAQEQEDKNEIFVVYNMKPMNDEITQFESAWKEHNEMYHEDSPVFAFYLETGPVGGHYQGVEGPKTWTGHENFEYTDAHGQHWVEQVMPLIDGTVTLEYWKRMKDYTHNPSDSPVTTSIVNLYTIEEGQYNRFIRVLKDWHKANTEQNYDGRYNVYERQLHGTTEIAIVGSLDNGLAEFDEPSNLKKRFTETHSEMMWELFIDDVRKSVKNSDVVLRVALPDISTPQQN